LLSLSQPDRPASIYKDSIHSGSPQPDITVGGNGWVTIHSGSYPHGWCGIHVAMLATMEPLVGSQELTRLLGVTRARITQLSLKPGFPAPAQVLAMGKIWTLASIQEWADRRGRILDLQALDGRQAGDDSTP